MLADFYSCPEFAPWRIITHATDTGSIIFLQRLVHLVLLMCTITDIAPAIVKCVQIYMVYFIARPVFKQIIMEGSSLTVNHIILAAISFAAQIKFNCTNLFDHIGIYHKNLTACQFPIGYKAVFRKPIFYITHLQLPPPYQVPVRRYVPFHPGSTAHHPHCCHAGSCNA